MMDRDNIVKEVEMQLEGTQTKGVISIETEKSDLEVLKEAYSELRDKYSLPSFEDLNADFQIEKIQDTETEVLIREIRKYVGDKFSSYFRFIETLIQPANAQMFVFMMLKHLDSTDNIKLQSIYKKLSKFELELIELDLVLDLDKEAVFIKDTFVAWQEIKFDLLDIIKKIKSNWGNGNSPSEDRRYFG